VIGLWLEDRRLSLRADLELPRPAPGEALVRVLRAGICNTDLELVRGYYPYCGILGHEFVGRVEEGAPHLLGERVVGEINAVCGRCRECLAGRRSHCLERTVLGIVNRHGAFAEYLALPAANLHPVSGAVATDAATFVEPLAAALEIQQQVQIRPEDRVLVAGAGKLGQLVAQTLALRGCQVVAAGRRPERQAALAACGISTVPAAAVAEKSFDLAVECTGNPEGFELARRALRPRGTLVMKSTYAGRLSVDAAALVVDELTLVGSRCGPFAPALRLLAEGRVAVEPLIEARFPLRQGEAAFARAAEPGALKVLLEMGGDHE
jgi:threonine dehydrogenase-like Zn-dependent dehydrogenase